MAAPSFFCEHRRLRTSCPDCRPQVDAALAAARPPVAASPARERAEPGAPAGPRPLGRPVRRRKKGVTREEADSADAWWVKK